MSQQPEPGGYDPAAYGREWAHDYDELYAGRDDLDQVVAFVRERAPGGRVLEMGVGTGRLALPLAAAGLDVTGVDASAEMLALLAARPGAERLHVVAGDFASVALPGRYDLVLFAFSTLFLVTTQGAQQACLRNAARHLAPGGAVLIEAFVPDRSRWTRDQHVSIGRLGPDEVTLKLSTHDPLGQVIHTQDVTIGHRGLSLRGNTLRYAWPAELDAMAVAAGLTLSERVCDWAGSAFTAASTAHISVYRRAPDA